MLNLRTMDVAVEEMREETVRNTHAKVKEVMSFQKDENSYIVEYENSYFDETKLMNFVKNNPYFCEYEVDLIEKTLYFLLTESEGETPETFLKKLVFATDCEELAEIRREDYVSEGINNESIGCLLNISDKERYVVKGKYICDPDDAYAYLDVFPSLEEVEEIFSPEPMDAFQRTRFF